MALDRKAIERAFDDLWELVEIERPETIDRLRHMMRSGWIFAASELIAAERARTEGSDE